MDRKKILTGVLLIAVVLVWGSVIYRVIKGGRPVKVSSESAVTQMSETNENRNSLKLNYRDPFLGEFVRATKPAAKSAIPDVAKAPEVVPVPDFVFKGVIGNESGRRASVLKGGLLYLVSCGEKIGEFEVIAMCPACLTIKAGKNVIEMKAL